MPRKKRIPRKHSVKAFVQIHELTKAGTSIKFDLYADQEKIGTIVIGRGSITWYGRYRKKQKTISWSRFAEFMDKYAYGP